MNIQSKSSAVLLFCIALFFNACDDAGSGVANVITDSEAVTTDAALLDDSDFIFNTMDNTIESVSDDFTLPVIGDNGCTIAWESEDESVIIIAPEGSATVSRPVFGSGNATITITATISRGYVSATVDFELTVLEMPPTDGEMVGAAAVALDPNDISFVAGNSSTLINANFTLPTAGEYGTTISWTEKSDTGGSVVLSGTGNSAATVSNSSWSESDGFYHTVVLTATITRGTEVAQKDIELQVIPQPPRKVAVSASGVSFKMVLVPGGLTCPLGTNDDGSAMVDNSYWIGETEVTYELWTGVRTWAVDGTGSATGEGEYAFYNVGFMGDGTSAGITSQHPVTMVNWRNAMVWCNALTEAYNDGNGTSLSCVYYSDSACTIPIRDASTTGVSLPDPGDLDNPYIKSDADGFRLPSSDEWELAARYRNGTLWLYGDHASGDTSGACYSDGSILGGQSVSIVISNYAVYTNQAGGTGAALSKTTNDLGLYGMSGNVREFSFDWYPGNEGTQRTEHNGSWNSSASMIRVGYKSGTTPYVFSNGSGFRITRGLQ